MEKFIDDSHIHDGHRSRMRAKLASHGQAIFDTYELLEMLLYYVIPYKDTNPIAKNLLYAFGNLDAVFDAEKGSLSEVKGVGEKASELITEVGRLKDIIGAELLSEDGCDFSSYESVGLYLTDYFSGIKDKQVVALYLDSAMHLIAMKKMYDLEYESGGVKAKPFIDEAVNNHAAVVITAHNHPYGPFYPTPGDRATNLLITESLDMVGIVHAEHYIISGNCFAGMGSLSHFNTQISQMPAVSEFIDTRDRFDGKLHRNNRPISEKSGSKSGKNLADADYFARLLSFSGCKNPSELTDLLLDKYRTIEQLLDASAGEISLMTGESVAIFIKLLAYLTSRRYTDSFTFGRAYSSADIAEYFKALFLGESVEKIYLIGFDAKGRIIGRRLLGEGTVNASEVMPRKAMEAALAMSAASVSVAHNHPFGTVNPSDDDVNMTQLLVAMFASCGIGFNEHYVIAGQLCDTVFYGNHDI
ncbi:MAG: hypothetical protein J6V80_03460 [Clostridia bacterium]|nr:hypothetical protein [Clostridia bacterium]